MTTTTDHLRTHGLDQRRVSCTVNNNYWLCHIITASVGWSEYQGRSKREWMMKRIEKELLRKQHEREREREREISQKPQILGVDFDRKQTGTLHNCQKRHIHLRYQTEQISCSGWRQLRTKSISPTVRRNRMRPAVTRCVGVMLPCRCRMANHCSPFGKNELHPRE